jgi:transcriptional regulator with XRE-family HTH domain
MEEWELRNILAGNVKRFRQQNNISQMTLAEKLNISTNFLSDIERCKAWISPATLVNLASALNIEPYELFKADSFLSDTEKDILQQYAHDNLKAVLSVLNQMRGNYG